MDQQVGCPDAQAINKDHCFVIIVVTDCLRQVKRRFDKLPLWSTSLPMQIDPRFHLGVENLGCGDIDKAVPVIIIFSRVRVSQRLGMRGLARPCPAQNELDLLCHRFCLPPPRHSIAFLITIRHTN